jgi:hypothetical protein
VLFTHPVKQEAVVKSHTELTHVGLQLEVQFAPHLVGSMHEMHVLLSAPQLHAGGHV